MCTFFPFTQAEVSFNPTRPLRGTSRRLSSTILPSYTKSIHRCKFHYIERLCFEPHDRPIGRSNSKRLTASPFSESIVPLSTPLLGPSAWSVFGASLRIRITALAGDRWLTSSTNTLNHSLDVGY